MSCFLGLQFSDLPSLLDDLNSFLLRVFVLSASLLIWSLFISFFICTGGDFAGDGSSTRLRSFWLRVVLLATGLLDIVSHSFCLKLKWIWLYSLFN